MVAIRGPACAELSQTKELKMPPSEALIRANARQTRKNGKCAAIMIVFRQNPDVV
jgi:hypothetical protein